MEHLQQYLGRLANHGAEAENKNITTMLFKHSQLGGWCGNGKGAKMKVIIGYAKRKWLYRMGLAQVAVEEWRAGRAERREAAAPLRVQRMVRAKAQQKAAREAMAVRDFDGGLASEPRGRRGGQDRRPRPL